jgi:hypothetical protein
MTESIDFEKWINDYIKDHECYDCQGTGSIGKAPWSYTCEFCKGTGINSIGRSDPPTFDRIFWDLLKAENMEDVNQVIIKYQKKILVSDVLFAKISKLGWESFYKWYTRDGGKEGKKI